MENEEIISLDVDSELLCQFRTVCENEGISEEKAILLFLGKVCKEKALLSIIAEALEEERKSGRIYQKLLDDDSLMHVKKDDLLNNLDSTLDSIRANGQPTVIDTTDNTKFLIIPIIADVKPERKQAQNLDILFDGSTSKSSYKEWDTGSPVGKEII